MSNRGRVGGENGLVEWALQQFIKLVSLPGGEHFTNFQPGVLQHLAHFVLAITDDFLGGLVFFFRQM